MTLIPCSNTGLLSTDAFATDKTKHDYEDMRSLEDVSDSSVVENLRKRFNRDAIYTLNGPLLIALNPFKRLPIYGPKQIEEYRGRSGRKAPAHVFALADETYRAMCGGAGSQSIIISGESGAGKTETTKIVMQYVAAVGGRSFAGHLERQILESNPVLEAFGNAKTLRNHNSSRFGKYIEIQFDSNFSIAGARISHYLLEKSRVVNQMKGERNYHIFYQLCSGASPQDKEELHLTSVLDFRYLNHSGCFHIEGLSEAQQFERTKAAMSVVGIEPPMQAALFRMVAGILHLGNVSFVASPNHDAAQIEDMTVLKTAADLLGISATALEVALCKREIRAASDTVIQSHTCEQAGVVRDALAKAVYIRLFDWIVDHINNRLRCHSKIESHIGILDISGFEVFETNRFEQLCINYTNEKLQQFFNAFLYQQERSEYVREGLGWSQVEYDDNQDCVDLIEKRGGVLSLLDDECVFPNGTDASLVQKLLAAHKDHPRLHKERFSSTSFVIHHFAGEVTYDCQGILAKNRDTLPLKLVSIFRDSAVPLCRNLFDNIPTSYLSPLRSTLPDSNPSVPPVLDDVSAALYSSRLSRSASATRKLAPQFITLAIQYKEELSALVRSLAATSPHFIRCVKASLHNLPNDFNTAHVSSQLRALGVFEAIRMTTCSYPARASFGDFASRYRVLLPKAVDGLDPRDVTVRVLDSVIRDSASYRLGSSKVFLKFGIVPLLEQKREALCDAMAVVLQSWSKSRRARLSFLQCRLSCIRMQSATRAQLALTLLRRLRRERKAAQVLQAVFRRYSCSALRLRSRVCITVLQSAWRASRCRLTFVAVRRRWRAAVRIQKLWRCRYSHWRWTRLLSALVCIQKHFRARRVRSEVQRLRKDHSWRTFRSGLDTKLLADLRIKSLALQKEIVQKAADRLSAQVAVCCKDNSALRSSLDHVKTQLAESEEEVSRQRRMKTELARQVADVESERLAQSHQLRQLRKQLAQALKDKEKAERDAEALRRQLAVSERRVNLALIGGPPAVRPLVMKW